MSVLSNFYPLLGQPTRTTRYEYGTNGIYTHHFVPGCRWCRMTMVGGGGKGGDSGKWQSGTYQWYYVSGGGGGGGETVIVEWDPSYAQVAGGMSIIVGAANGGTSYAWAVEARGGAAGENGQYEDTPMFRGGQGGGLQRLGVNDSDTEKPTLPNTSYSFPGMSGGEGPGVGGNSMYGVGGANGGSGGGGPCPPGSVGTGYGAGGGGGGTTSDTSGSQPLGAGGNGTPGLIVIEEWVY
jgi:hypothetical protein